MALKALISRKWKLDNCSAERDRRARGPDGRRVVFESALKPNQTANVNFNILCKTCLGGPLERKHLENLRISLNVFKSSLL